MARELRIGIIGVGQIGKSHLKKWQDVPGVKVVAAVDIDEAELKRVAGEYAIEKTYFDFRDMLAREDVEAVDVCLHNNLHAPVSMAVMDSGRHVYCEKPLAGSYIDALAMVEKARQTGQMLQMQLASLYSTETKAARRLIDEGYLGQPYYAKSSSYRRRGRPFVDGYGTDNFVKKEIAAGGALFDMGVYHISQILYLLSNPDVLTISGSTHQQIDMYPDRRASSGYSVEELGIALVRLAGGATFFIEEAWAVNLGGTDGSKIAGSKGGLTLSPFAYHATVGDMEMDGTFNLKAADYRWGQCSKGYRAYESSQHHWAAALRGEVELLPTARIGLNTMLISEGVYLSQRLGREVTPADVKEHSVSTAIDVAAQIEAARAGRASLA